MILTDEICDKLCVAAREKSRELGIDISFVICDEHGLLRVYRRFGEVLVFKHYTSSGQGIHLYCYTMQDKRCGGLQLSYGYTN
ncbi:hypothetical protein [Helicobacter sp. MIT 14-3879]|uniref:hypothetical protein n=1 Tax=Helicobacter sp. MIT 14-3879 TaxID=2040649 RepID=UPI001C6A2A95|nr:hypothetical protein [Helicobacter sp. MIT 14-3879]